MSTSKQAAIASGDFHGLVVALRAQLITNQVEIPQELKERKGWLNYKVTSIAPTGKFNKIPIYPRTGSKRKGEQGAPADLANLGTWAEAWQAFQDNTAIAGVGFACLAPFGVVALDVDHCVVDGVIRPDVEPLIEDTYCEFSPSGTGIRAFWLGSSSNSKNNSTGYELFHSKGFVTVTGDFVVGGDVPLLPDSLRDRLEALATARPKAETPIRASGDLGFLNSAPVGAARANPMDFKAPLQALARQYANNPQATYLKAVEALKFISADCGYDTWIKVGQALHDAFGEHGFTLWDDWSSGGAKYKGQADIDTHWRTFHQGGGVGIGTVFYIAKESGYQGQAGVLHQPFGADFSGLTIDNETGEVANHPLAVFVDCDAKAKPPRWVIPGFIGHGVTVISGGHGVGKTTALLPLAMTAAGLHGDELMPNHWRHVVYITEDIEQAKRILAGIVLHSNLGIQQQAVKERLHLVEAVRLDPFAVAKVSSTYRKNFTRMVGCVNVLPLVVLDTKSAVLSLDNENDNSEASRMMAALKQGFGGLPVWLVGHVAKGTAGNIEGLTSRGASAIEADANQTLFLINDKGRRYFKLGKTRFEPKWQELEITSHTFGTTEIDEFGNSELVTLRWSIASPAWQSSAEAKERALEAQKKEKVASVRRDILDAVATAWALVNPINRQTIKSAVGGNGQFVGQQIDLLLAERWLHEIQVPSKERLVNSKSTFFISLTSQEHDALLAGANLPQEKTVIPATWKKLSIPPIPESLEG